MRALEPAGEIPSAGEGSRCGGEDDAETERVGRVVGAPRFELGTSCAQVRRTISWKSFLFNLSFENKRVRKIFGSGTVCRNVAPHAWSPPNFPLSEKQQNASADC